MAVQASQWFNRRLAARRLIVLLTVAIYLGAVALLS